MNSLLPQKSSASRRPLWLVTGAAGFIGARFTESCHAQGIEVVTVDELSFFDSRPEHRGLDFGTRVDRDEFFAWLERENPALDGVIHLGACSSTTETDEQYLRRVNVEYSQNLWNYCSIRKIPFLYASSAATYGDGAEGYADVEASLQKLVPLNLYGESKHTFDLWALNQELQGNHPPAWAGFKFFNVYGFGERHKGPQASVALHAFDQIGKSGKVRLFKSDRVGIADGEQKRDFIFVDDVIDVLHFARKGGIRRGIFNLGTGEARSFRDLAGAVFAALGKPESIEWIEMPESLRSRYQYFTQATMEKLRTQGYARPFTSLEEGVKRYVERLRSFEAG